MKFKNLLPIALSIVLVSCNKPDVSLSELEDKPYYNYTNCEHVYLLSESFGTDIPVDEDEGRLTIYCFKCGKEFRIKLPKVIGLPFDTGVSSIYQNIHLIAEQESEKCTHAATYEMDVKMTADDIDKYIDSEKTPASPEERTSLANFINNSNFHFETKVPYFQFGFKVTSATIEQYRSNDMFAYRGEVICGEFDITHPNFFSVWGDDSKAYYYSAYPNFVTVDGEDATVVNKDSKNVVFYSYSQSFDFEAPYCFYIAKNEISYSSGRVYDGPTAAGESISLLDVHESSSLSLKNGSAYLKINGVKHFVDEDYVLANGDLESKPKVGMTITYDTNYSTNFPSTIFVSM